MCKDASGEDKDGPLFIYGDFDSVITDSTGCYIFTDVPSGNYMIEPVDTIFNFAPVYYEVALEESDLENFVFLASPDSSSGIFDPYSKDLFSLNCYPNPASDFIFLDFDSLSSNEEVEINIFTIEGKKVFHDTVRPVEKGGIIKVDLPADLNGICIVDVYYRDHRVTNKMIIY